MLENQPSFTPPTIESQYRYLHPSHIPPARLAEMQQQIAEFGHAGEVFPLAGLHGAVEIIEPERPGGLLKIMPDAVEIPYDHPARVQDRSSDFVGNALARILSSFDSGSERVTSPLPERNATRIANEQANQSVAEMGTTNEELASFLQSFVTAADASHLGYGYGADYDMIHYRGFDNLHRMFVEPFGESGTKYALLRIDMQHYRRPYAPDENYTVVNMDTGDALSFSYSNIGRVQSGEYAITDDKGKVRVLDPRDVAKVAGIVDPHGPDDPLRALRKDGTLLAAILETDDQLERFERLRSLGGPIYENAHITFAPATVEELITFVTRLGSDHLAGRINAVVVPEEGTVAIVEDKEHRYIIDSLLRTVGKFDDETQRAIYATVDSIRVDAQDSWTRYSRIEKIIRDAVHINEDGTYTKKPAAELLKRLTSNRYDFLEAVYKIAGGMYLEVSSQNWDEKTVTREVSEHLDEEKARTYAEIFEWELMETVDIARGSLHIPDDIEPIDQVVTLLKLHGYTEKGMRLVDKDTVNRHRPDISIPEWAEICMIIDRCRDNNPINKEDRAVIEKHKLNADSIARYWKSGPGSSAEHIAEALVRPLSLR